MKHTYFRKALCSKRTSLKRAFFPWQNNQNTHRWNIPQSISHFHGHFVAKSLHWKKNLTISIIIIYGRIDTVANKWCEPNFIYARDIYHKNIFRVPERGRELRRGWTPKKIFFYIMKNSSIRNRHTLTYQTQLYYKNNNLLIHPKKDILCQLRLIKFKFFTPFTYTYKCGFGLEWAIAY